MLLPASTQGQVGGGQAFVNTIPTQTYFNAIEELYRGDYRDAQRDFLYEVKGSVKIGVTQRWIDAICYHAMLGETFYHYGQPAEALEQYNLACAMYLQYPNWMLQITFEPPRPDTNQIRKAIPWGRSNRQFTLGKFSNQMRYLVGDIRSAQRALQAGGRVQQAQFWQLNVMEVVRCTALAIRRRNELLGPLAPDDATTKAMVSALSRGAAPPNHWSSAWVDLQLGLAYVGQGKIKLALPRLARAERIAGQYDHPLTSVALLEQGRLAMEGGRSAEADRLLSEASYSGFYYEDPGIIDEAFRLMTTNRLAAGIQSPNPKLEPAALWARRKRFDHIFSRLNLAYAEELIRLENWDAAAGAVKTAQSRLQDAVRGRLGNQAQYLSARILLAAGNDKGRQQLIGSLEREAIMSTRNFQIGLANQMFDSRQIRSRIATNVYASLLSDPTPSDWVFRPMKTMAVLKTPHGAGFDRWIAAHFAQKNPTRALEVADRAKRRHYHAMLPLGGRKAALADLLETSPLELSEEDRTRRNTLLLRLPGYQQAQQTGQDLREQIRGQWVPGMEADAQSDLVRVWRNWSKTLAAREAMLTTLALDRVATEFHFPPQRNVDFVKSQLKPGQALLVFHDSPEGLLGFLVTSSASTNWNCGPSSRVGRQLTKFLRDMGNYDATHDLTAEELANEDWLESGKDLYAMLLGKSSLDLGALDELIVVPDGLLWYVPFGALPIEGENETVPLVSLSKLRVAPTMGLAVGKTVPWRRIQHSAIVGRGIVPGDKEDDRLENLQPLISSLDQPVDLPNPLPVSAHVFGSMLDTMIVLEEQELTGAQPLAWEPLPTNRASAGSSIDAWLGLPRQGPQRMIYPAMRTAAENGGKNSRRKSSVAPGTELFLASCGLMSSGAQTILLSRWRVGGKSTMEITREFVQELPHTTAADAWQRTVQLAMELPIEPIDEPRVKAGKNDPALTAAHPIFWGGYLLIDAGAPSAEEAEDGPKAAELSKAAGRK